MVPCNRCQGELVESRCSNAVWRLLEINGVTREPIQMDSHTTTTKSTQAERLPLSLTTTLFVALNSWKFFKASCDVNCSVSRFCAFDGADGLKGISEVFSMQLVDIMPGVKISNSVPLSWGVAESCFIRASLSHKGIFAFRSLQDEKMVMTFRNIISDEVATVDSNNDCQVGFYDDNAVIIERGRLIQEANISSIFQHQGHDIFTTISEIQGATPYSDMSRLNETRKMLFTTTDDVPFEFDVDTRRCKILFINKDVYSFASTTGITLGYNYIGVFQESGMGNNTYVLTRESKATFVSSLFPNNSLAFVFPSSSDPEDMEKALLLFDNGCCCVGNGDTSSVNHVVEYFPYYSIVRVFKDVFIMYDKRLQDWVIIRICIE